MGTHRGNIQLSNSRSLSFDLLEDPKLLADCQGWSEEVYRDLLAYHDGTLSEEGFRRKYEITAAILILDMTGFTEAAMAGEMASFMRILRVHMVCVPVLRQYGANQVRSFADDLCATYPDAESALAAALEVHRRIRAFNASALAGQNPAECCIGLGYGDVLRIGKDNAMGDEMNRASKLGEDTAKGYETLITENFYGQVSDRDDFVFEQREGAEYGFPYYAVTSREP